jgi:hypothetical protein
VTTGGDDDILRWLRDVAGIAEPRRVVRRSAGSILVSKFDEGFAARLHETIDRLPGMFDDSLVAARFAELSAAEPGRLRAETWRLAVNSVVNDAAAREGIHPDAVAEVRAGIDSVAGLLDAILWTGPSGGEPHVPEPSEVEAYRDTRARMDAERGLFTRYYGSFEGVPVENHCPGSQVARRLFAQGWAISTGGA